LTKLRKIQKKLKTREYKHRSVFFCLKKKCSIVGVILFHRQSHPKLIKQILLDKTQENPEKLKTMEYMPRSVFFCLKKSAP